MFTRLFLSLVLLSGYALAAPKDYVCSKSQLEAISKGKGELAFSGRSIIMVDTIEFKKFSFSNELFDDGNAPTIDPTKKAFSYMELYKDQVSYYKNPNANDMLVLCECNGYEMFSREDQGCYNCSRIGNYYQLKTIKPLTKKNIKKYPKNSGFVVQSIEYWQKFYTTDYRINSTEYYTCGGKLIKTEENSEPKKNHVDNEKSPFFKEVKFLQKIKSGESYPSRVY
ncbi:MAG: hypothetical protein M1486_05780 [Gammaproteobacteria bacterium]|nr:hypothetical protein [Gammaproteobacteria bacterium]